MKLREWLKGPYPKIETVEEKLSFALFNGMIVSLIILLIQPYGVNEITVLKELFIVGFGVVTTGTFLVFFMLLPKLFPRFFSPERWCVWKELSFIVLLMLVTSNFLWYYNDTSAVFFEAQEYSLPEFLKMTIQIGTVLALMSILYKKYVFRGSCSVTSSRNPENGEGDEDRMITISDEKGSEVTHFSESEFLYAKIEGNYLQIRLNRSGTDNTLFLRMTMTKLEEIFSDHDYIIRCHRSFLVNLALKEDFKKSKKGYYLTFQECSEKVPVSRRFSAVVKSHLDTSYN